MGIRIDAKRNGPVSTIELKAIVISTIPYSKYVDELKLPDGKTVLRFQNQSHHEFTIAKELSLNELCEFLYKYIVEIGIAHGRQLQQQDFRMAIGIEDLVAT